MTSLHDLGKKHGTDKWDQSHSFMGESYLDIYEHYLAPLRSDPVNILELGVGWGGSLRMWKEYFPKAQIFGVDINWNCQKYTEDRIEIVTASQDEAGVLLPLADRAGGFDVIVDDASHLNTLTVASFQILFPHLRPGGFYIVEDLGMSHIDLSANADDPHFMEGSLQANRLRGVDISQQRTDLEALFHRLLQDMDMNRGQLRFLHFWSKIAVLQKGKPTAMGDSV